MKVLPSKSIEDKITIIGSCGKGKDSHLCIMKNEIKTIELVSLQLPAKPIAMWSLRWKEENEQERCKYIAVSFSNITMILENMIEDDEIVGGVIVTINENNHNHLDFLFVKVGVQSKGIGQMIWKEIEKLYPDTEVWETCTPYFDKRNIHFYVNRLKFHIVEYFNLKHPDTNRPLDCYEEDDGMFRFEKVMK